MEIWLKDIRQHSEKDLPIFKTINKNDLEKEVEIDEDNIFIESNRTTYFVECSSKSFFWSW